MEVRKATAAELVGIRFVTHTMAGNHVFMHQFCMTELHGNNVHPTLQVNL